MHVTTMNTLMEWAGQDLMIVCARQETDAGSAQLGDLQMISDMTHTDCQQVGSQCCENLQYYVMRLACTFGALSDVTV